MITMCTHFYPTWGRTSYPIFILPPSFNSFHSPEAWKESVKKSKPDRMEIGPVYSQEPRLKDGLHKDHFYPVSRELIFDIDMDDYDEVG